MPEGINHSHKKASCLEIKIQDLIVVEMENNSKIVGSGIGAEKTRSCWQERRDAMLLPVKAEAQKENPLSDKVQELITHTHHFRKT